MWQKVLQFSKEILALKRQTKVNASEIKEIRQDIRDLTEAVRQIANAIQQDRTNNSHQQEMMTEAVRQLADAIQQDRTNNNHQQEMMVEKLKNALMQFEIKLLKGEYSNTLNSSEKNKKE